MRSAGQAFCVLLGLFLGLGIEGCATSQAPPAVTYSDGAPHPLPPVLRERRFDGSLYGPGGLGDLASDYVAVAPGDQILIRFDPKNGYPGIPQSRVTHLMGQVVRVDRSGTLLVSAQRTIRDSSGVRKVVLVGRVVPSSIETGNEVSVSHVSMLRFRSDGPTDQKKAPNFGGGSSKKPGAPLKKGLGRTP